jgi:excisionase family DNA binding protein
MTALVVIEVDLLRELLREVVRDEQGATLPANEWVRTAAAANILGRHPKTVARMARRGEIPATRLGNQWRFRRADLDAHLAGART